MKKIKLIAILLFICFITFGCMSFTRLNTTQVKSFNNEMLSNYKQIKKINVSFSTPSLDVDIFLKTAITEEEKISIFKDTKALVQNEKFQDEFFTEFFKKHYKTKGEERVYPTVFINFFEKGNKGASYQYFARYYEQPYNSGINNKIDLYKTWYFNNYEDEAIKIPPEL